ncbi:MAG: AraC family transcriptional regulator [Eubacteriales bacterium]|nr:AraC family transcriptional regulator [Eubacteriales bacterium]
MPEHAHSISFKDIKPFIRLARHFDSSTSKQPVRRFINVKSYDHRLFYITGGEGTIEIEGISYHAEKGCLFYWLSGTGYSVFISEKTHLEFLQLNFDFCQSRSDLSYPILQNDIASFAAENIVEVIRFSDLEEFNHPIILKGMNMAGDTMLELKNEFETKMIFYENRMSALAVLIFNDIARSVNSISMYPYMKGHKIDKIIKYIHNNYSRNITNHTIGAMFNYHANYVNHLMRQNTGKSLHHYLLEYRISKAIDLIQTTGMTMTEIADAVGFSNSAHFSKQFKKMTDRNPMQFRKNYNV